jgi:aminoacyl tRNA synthase complex-interacting multifunctional protein 1
MLMFFCFQDLDSSLTSVTYLVSNYPTAADFALFALLHTTFSQLQPEQYYGHPALTRYFDHVQNLPAVRSSSVASSYPLIHFDLENAPKLERKADPPKEKKKKESKETEAANAPANGGGGVQIVKDKVKKGAEVVKDAVQGAVAAVASGSGEAKKEKPAKEKKEKKEKAPAAPKAATTEEGAGEPVPSMIDLRVGHIVEIMKHPDADGLYVEVSSRYACEDNVLIMFVPIANRLRRGDRA